MALTDTFSEAHFCCLPSQSNVYGLAKTSMPCGKYKLIVASLRGSVYSMEYQTDGRSAFEKLRPLTREVQFTYIPGDAEIISIDAFNKTGTESGVVIAITFIKDSENKPSQFLNIYSDWDPEKQFNIESIAQNCLSYDLSFVPYGLYHKEHITSTSRETVFLLSGSDHKIHLYKENSVEHTFTEEPVEKFFPEFHDIQSSVMSIDVRYFSDTSRRLTAFGCKDGHLTLMEVDTYSNEILNQWSTQMDGPVTTVKLFQHRTEFPCPEFLQKSCTDKEAEKMQPKEQHQKPEYNALVTNATELSVVYRDVLRSGLDDVLVLPDSDQYDCVLCSCPMDVDFDGEMEVVLGTYGQEMLVYKLCPPDPVMTSSLNSDFQNRSRHESAKTFSGRRSPLVTDSFSGVDKNIDDMESMRRRSASVSETRSSELESCMSGNHIDHQTQGVTDARGAGWKYKLFQQRSFTYPLLAMDKADTTGDGLDELAILSLKGLHILQHNLQEAARVCLQRLEERFGGDPFDQIHSSAGAHGC